VLKNRLRVLEDLEAYHAGQLAHVQAMIAAERGQPVEQKNGSDAGARSNQPFSKLTKADAVALILKEKGQMHVSKIFASIRRRGHPVKSKNSLSNLLSTSDRFEKQGKGIWALARQNEN
jgi:hypothetical protein